MLGKKIAIGLLAGVMCFLTGCKDVQIFRENRDPNEQIQLTDKELENDTYYVKNGTRFVSVYFPRGNAREIVNAIKKDRVFYMVSTTGDEGLVPEHYRGEVVAYASESSDLPSVTLERFKDIGYSIGLYGGTFKNDGYYHINLSDDEQVIGSTMLAAMQSTASDEIRVKAINDVALTEEMIDKNSGVFLGLEEGKTYKVSFFSGTYYYEADVVADTHFLQSFELYAYDGTHLTDTLNGYKSFETPENLKSGWYNINGKGLFKYYDFIKGEENVQTVDMNQNFYSSEEEMIKACSAEYTFSVNETTNNLVVSVKESENYSYSDIAAYVYSPNDTRYNMEYDEEEKTIKAVIANAIPGKWRINVLPKDTNIQNIDVKATEIAAELTLVEKIVSIEEEQANLCICIDYEGTGTVNGTIITPSGETYIMEEQDVTREENGIIFTKMQYVFPYAEVGNYYVRMYHHPSETTIGEPYIEKDGGNAKDVIIVTE